jgi:hypothetical protein
VLETLLDI